MRMLMLLRGLPASGKSTFIRENNLSDYTVSSDTLRLLFGSNELTTDGKYATNQAISGTMWKFLYELLEKRFEIGAFTVLDATNIKESDIKKTKDLAIKYRYRVYCVDFSDVPVEECIKRDAQRDESKRVGKEVIQRMAESLKNSKVPGGIVVLKPSEWRQETRYRISEIDSNVYKKVHHIGDIHGCYTALQDYLQGDLKDDEFYIFLGDYIDRGIENREVINFISNIADRPNVVLLEGNHERHLKPYINDETSKSPEFEEKTKIELDKDNSMKKKCKIIYQKLRQCFLYKYNEKVVLCTHGGLSKLPANLSLVNAEQMIKGVGRYTDMLQINQSFAESVKGEEIYQVHGHRNIEQVEIKVNEHCFNLNGNIEYGGNLRTLTLDSFGFEWQKTPNPVYSKPDGANFVKVEDMVEVMQNSEYVKVKEQEGTDIVSLNFTKDAFKGSVWDGITTRARGLFVNTKTNKIVARSYDKFFNLNERAETNLDVVPNRFVYPVTAYKKENGFLGILGYDESTAKILYCSKSEVIGEYSQYFKDILLSFVTENELIKVLKGNNISLLFEVVDIKNDPHIIKYRESAIYLLDIVENKVNFKSKDFEEVERIANLLAIPCKLKCKVLRNKEEFIEFLEEAMQKEYKLNGKYIEGLVFEDAHKNMVKLKTEYYKFWKFLRSQIEVIAKGGTSKIENDFIRWVMQDKKRTNLDIITLRETYEKERNKK